MSRVGRCESLVVAASDVLAEERREGRCCCSFLAGNGGSEFGSKAGTRNSLERGPKLGVVALVLEDKPDTEERADMVEAMESFDSRLTSACEPLDLDGNGGGPPPL